MGVELFVGAILESNTDIYSTIFFLESIQLDSSNKTYAIWKKNTHLLLAFEELDIEIE